MEGKTGATEGYFGITLVGHKNEVVLKLIIKCLELMTDLKLGFREPLVYAYEKAVRANSYATRTMSNWTL